jgi:hypothetical protein
VEKRDEKVDDGVASPPKPLFEDCQNRLAAAEYDLLRLASHIKNGSHPDLNQT